MKSRLLAVVMLLALALQGPLTAYSAVLGSVAGSGGRASCGDQGLAGCELCCSGGSGSSCSASCVVSVVAALPTTNAPLLAKAQGASVPDCGVALFASHDPAQLLRPPIA